MAVAKPKTQPHHCPHPTHNAHFAVAAMKGTSSPLNLYRICSFNLARYICLSETWKVLANKGLLGEWAGGQVGGWSLDFGTWDLRFGGGFV